jgi:hypothetical protein
MRWLCLLAVFLLCISFPVVAIEIVLEQQNGEYLLILTSEEKTVISGYTVQLDFDQIDTIIEVQSVSPFDLFAYHDNGNGVLRISGITTSGYSPSNYIPLARIYTKSPFSPTITVESLRDYNLNVLIGSDINETASYPDVPNQSQTYSPPVTSAVTVPLESRLPWTMPDLVIGEATINPVPPTMISGTDDEDKIQSSDNSNVVFPFGLEEETPISESHTGVSDPTALKSPVSLVTIIMGIIIVMFIIYCRE